MATGVKEGSEGAKKEVKEAMIQVTTQPVGLFAYCCKFVHHFLAEEGPLASIYDINHTVNLVGQCCTLPKHGIA